MNPVRPTPAPVVATLLLALLLHPAFPSPRADDPPEPLPPLDGAERPGLRNLHRITEKLLSGSAPDGEPGFRSLAELGVKTIVSVDGAPPDLPRAAEHGMRYVHIPVGYDGIPRETVLRVAKAVRDLPGPVYIHCHRGKHRGPAAALAARLVLDETCRIEDVLETMRRVGVDPGYRGLYDTPRRILEKPPAPGELDRLPDQFPDQAEVAPLVRLMAEIDLRADHLDRVRNADWKTPDDHPDLDPAQEALLLLEQFRETARLPEIRNRPRTFAELLAESETQADRLRQALRNTPPDAAAAETAYRKIKTACARCHDQHRDNPRP